MHTKRTAVLAIYRAGFGGFEGSKIPLFSDGLHSIKSRCYKIVFPGKMEGIVDKEMTEREAFEAWYAQPEINLHWSAASSWEGWQAACKWQREKDAEIFAKVEMMRLNQGSKE